MSGSGSSVFALTANRDDALALEKKFRGEFSAALFATPFHVIAG